MLEFLIMVLTQKTKNKYKQYLTVVRVSSEIILIEQILVRQILHWIF